MSALEDLRASLAAGHPPAGLAPLVEAMWWEAKGDWQKAHAIAQDIATRDGSWVHAYLHRREGDASNAGYWYRQAQRPHPGATPEAEWDEIVTTLLKKTP